MTTKLGAAQQMKPATELVSKLGMKISGGRRGEDVELPGDLGHARMSILGAREQQEVQAAAMARLNALGMAWSDASHNLILEIALGTLARSVTDAEGKPFGTLEEWGRVDSDRIVACWQLYGDIRERLDPLAGELDADEMALIAAAVKKKDGPSLRSFGVVKLSLWLRSMADLLSTSPPPSSSSGASQSDS